MGKWMFPERYSNRNAQCGVSELATRDLVEQAHRTVEIETQLIILMSAIKFHVAIIMIWSFVPTSNRAEFDNWYPNRNTKTSKTAPSA